MEPPEQPDARTGKGFRISLGFGLTLVGAVTAVGLVCVGCFLGPFLTAVLRGHDPGAASREEADAAWSAYLASSPAPSVERVFTVAVYADEEFREREGWQETAGALIDDASEIFAREFKIGFDVVSVGEWESRAGAADIRALAADARELVRPGTDLFAVFVGQTGPAGTFSEYDRGYAPYFGRLLLMRPSAPGESWFYERETIAHEFGHLFGAWHPPSGESLMRVDKYGPERFTFDARSRAVIERIAQLDLARGLDALDAAARKDLDALYAADYFCRDEHPLAYELIRRAHQRMRRKGDPNLIRDELERGLAIGSRWPSRWNERTREREGEIREYLGDE